MDPTFFYLDAFAGAAYREKGQYGKALAEYSAAQRLFGDQPLHGYIITYARMGNSSEARAMLARLQAYAREHYVNPMFFAEIHASLGEKDLAFKWLDRAAEDRTVWVLGLNLWPELDPLRSDPRFAALRERLSLSPKRTSSV